MSQLTDKGRTTYYSYHYQVWIFYGQNLTESILFSLHLSMNSVNTHHEPTSQPPLYKIVFHKITNDS